ncbi:MAG: asparagine synthase (glutamine-hydrolyzing) [Candidatus Woesebacteria bacterium]|jgi:asparagine synthase (glutamine-hydrolysing)
MCAIAGFIGLKNQPLLKKMTASLSHRGPDGEGQFSSQELSFGHRRLAVLDLSNKGQQPMLSQDRSIVISFNGEIYNFQNLKKQLKKRGYQFKSKTDTEVIIYAYQEWGLKQAVQKFEGDFAFSLWDKNKKTLFLVRDRIGIKPLYYLQQNGQLFFASEIKAILTNQKIKREIFYPAYWQYMIFQASMGENTLFKNIKKIPPATILTYKQGKVSLKKYWQLRAASQLEKKLSLSTKKNKKQSLQSQVKKILKQAVQKRLIADVPVGILLSGGLDSSSILALASQSSKKQIRTFAVGFGRDNDELTYAKLMAKKFNSQHQELLIKANDIRKNLPKIIYQQDEPLADGGGIASYFIAKEMSKKIKVVLTGEGADEIFAGYSWHKLGTNICKIFPAILKKEIYFYLTSFYRARNKNLFKKQSNYWRQKNEFEKLKKIFEANTDQQKISLSKKLIGLSKKKSVGLEFQNRQLDFLQQMMLFEIEEILPNSLCMKVDKMTSAWGLEARLPFLDHKLVEFVFFLPSSQKIYFNQSKILLRKIMNNDLPSKILKRKKQGFLLPVQQWLNHELKNFAKEIILDQNSHARQIYQIKALEKLFTPQKLLAELEKSNLIWRLLIFEFWYSKYL